MPGRIRNLLAFATMQLRGLGLRSDLMLIRFDGEVADRGDHLVVRTPTNPTFFWGNLLVFPRAPRPGDRPVWTSLFAAAHTDPRVRHMTFAWDEDDEGAAAEFVAAGFRLDRDVVLTARAADIRRAPKHHDGLEVRPIAGDADWDAATAVHLAGVDGPLPAEAMATFFRAQLARYRRMTEAGRGVWFGGFLDGRLVASLGVFHEGTLGRFQLVATHPAHRRQGVCGALVYAAARHAFARFGVETLVMVADEAYHAARIYESVGFRPVEHLLGVWRSDALTDGG